MLCLSGTAFTDLFYFVRLREKIPHFECAIPGYGEHEIRELAIPLISSSRPAGVLQQVMSPTLGQGYGTTVQKG